MKTKIFRILIILVFSSLFSGALCCCSEKDDWDFANSLYIRKMHDLAGKEYERFITAYPESSHYADACYRLGECLWNLERFDKALLCYQKLKNIPFPKPRDEVIRIREALCCKNLKDFGKAEELLENFSTEYPESSLLSIAFYSCAQVKAALGKNDGALKYYDKAIKAGGENARLALYQKGHLLIKADQPEQALASFQLLRKSNARDSIGEDSLFKTGELLHELKKYSEAFQAYSGFLKEYPASVLVPKAYRNAFFSLSEEHNLEGMKNFYEEYRGKSGFSSEEDFALFMLAETASAMKDYTGSLAFVRELQTKFAKSPFFAKSIVVEAGVLYSEEKYDEILKAVGGPAAAGFSGKEAAEISLIKGKALKKLGRVEDAEKEFAGLLVSGTPAEIRQPAYFEEADCLNRLGKYEQAALAMKKCLEDAGMSSCLEEATLKYSQYLSYSGDLEDAVSQLDIFMKKYPDSQYAADALYTLGVDHMKSSRYDRMEESFQKLLKKFPTRADYAPRALYWIGWNALRSGDYPRAGEYFEKIHEKFRNADVFYEASYWLGVACYSTGEKHRAVVLFLELLDKNKKDIFSETILFWFAEELLRNKDFVHAETVISGLREKAVSPEDNQRISCLEISLENGREDYAKALGLSEKFMKAEPQSPFIEEVRLLGIDALVALKKYAEAQAEIEQALKSENMDISFRASYKKAQIYEESGRPEEAAREFLRLAILYEHPMSPQAAFRAYEIFAREGKTDAAAKCREEIRQRWPASEEAGKLSHE